MKLAIPKSSDRVEWFMLVNHWLRVATKIEEIHGWRLEKETDPGVANESLTYYKNEQAILLGKMKAILDTAEPVAEKEEAPF